MAIFSLHHSSIGKSTQAQAGTAAAHVRYIARPGAAPILLAEHMPANSNQAQAWLLEQEAGDRKNGRVIDKVMLALPLELNADQRAALVRDFAQQATGGRAPWLAAIHQQGEDAANPHCHLIIRDKDPATGKRAVGLSEKGSTDRLRELWETVANVHLAAAGHDVRIDRRTLAEQRADALARGDLEAAEALDRKAQVHVGPRAAAMAAAGKARHSKAVVRPAQPPRAGGPRRRTDQIIDYTKREVRTRDAENARRLAANAQAAAARAAARPRLTPAERYKSRLWAERWGGDRLPPAVAAQLAYVDQAGGRVRLKDGTQVIDTGGEIEATKATPAALALMAAEAKAAGWRRLHVTGGSADWRAQAVEVLGRLGIEATSPEQSTPPAIVQPEPPAPAPEPPAPAAPRQETRPMKPARTPAPEPEAAAPVPATGSTDKGEGEGEVATSAAPARRTPAQIDALVVEARKRAEAAEAAIPAARRAVARAHVPAAPTMDAARARLLAPYRASAQEAQERAQAAQERAPGLLDWVTSPRRARAAQAALVAAQAAAAAAHQEVQRREAALAQPTGRAAAVLAGALADLRAEHQAAQGRREDAEGHLQDLGDQVAAARLEIEELRREQFAELQRLAEQNRDREQDWDQEDQGPRPGW